MYFFSTFSMMVYFYHLIANFFYQITDLLTALLQTYVEDCIETCAPIIHQSHMAIRMKQNHGKHFGLFQTKNCTLTPPPHVEGINIFYKLAHLDFQINFNLSKKRTRSVQKVRLIWISALWRLFYIVLAYINQSVPRTIVRLIEISALNHVRISEIPLYYYYNFRSNWSLLPEDWSTTEIIEWTEATSTRMW